MIYDAQCMNCGVACEYIRPAALYLDTPYCCGQKMQKVILSAPYSVVDIPAYQSPVTGRWVNSRAQRTEDLKRSGSRPWEGMEQESKVAQTRAKDEEKKADAKIEEAAVSAWHQLPSKKRRVLESAA